MNRRNFVRNTSIFSTGIISGFAQANTLMDYKDAVIGHNSHQYKIDYNTIKNNVKASLMKKVEASTLRTNAENRLLSELQDFYLLTNSMGWILLYEDERVENDFDQLMFKD